MKLEPLDYLLIIFAILSIAIIANCKEEPIVSMYQAPSDKDKPLLNVGIPMVDLNKNF